MTSSYNPDELFPAGASFTSTPWEVMPTYVGQMLDRGSIQVNWSGLDALTSTIEVEVSNDNANWSCYGGAFMITLDTNPDSQIFNFKEFTNRFIRVRYIPNTVTTGFIRVITKGVPR